MALTGNFISFPSVMESVYRKVGYQQVDINEVVETIGETLRLIGVLPAFTDVVTNGLDGNPDPIEIVDYKGLIPAEYITCKGCRKITLYDTGEVIEGEPVKRIKGFNTMTEATDIFYQSTSQQHRDLKPTTGIYTTNAVAVNYDLKLAGDSGQLQVSEVGNLTRVIVFDTDLETTATNFVNLYAADYELAGVTIKATDNMISFSETSGGSGTVVTPVIQNLSGNLNGFIERNDIVDGPVEIHGPDYNFRYEYEYTYKINNGYIHTNFREGFVEMSYSGFVVDEDGFPMIPDDQRYIEAIKWTLIEHIDYKKWRLGEIADKIYQDTEQKRAWYIASAIGKAAVPSADEMNALKKMMLRSIPKVNEHDSYFKYTGIGEQRYNLNSRRLGLNYNRR